MTVLFVLLFILRLGVCLSDPVFTLPSSLSETVTIGHVVVVPTGVAVLETALNCPDCVSYVQTPLTIPSTAMTVLHKSPHTMSAPAVNSHHKRSSKRSTSAFERRANSGEVLHSADSIDSGLMECRRGHCSAIKKSVRMVEIKTEPHPERIQFLQARLDIIRAKRGILSRGTSSDTMSHRKLLQFDTVIALAALALALAVQVELQNFENRVQGEFDLVNQKIGVLQNETIALSLAIQQNALNDLLLNGITAINGAITDTRLRSFAMAKEHSPGLLAIAALQEANCQTPADISGGCPHPIYQVPILYTGSIPTGGVFSNNLIYYALIDDSAGLLSILNFSNPCGSNPYLAARIEETIVPWGRAFYQAIVYTVTNH